MMNKKENREDNKQELTLTDLPLTSEQAEETKAGAGEQTYLAIKLENVHSIAQIDDIIVGAGPGASAHVR